MFLADLMVALLIALILTAIFAVGIRRHRAWPAILVFFTILFLSTWAVGAWITIGSLWGMPRLSYALVGLLFALLLTVLIPLSKYTGKEETREGQEKLLAILTFDIFFWILVIGLIMTIALRYIKIGY